MAEEVREGELESTHKKRCRERDSLIISGFLYGFRAKEIGNLAGVSTKTVYRRWASPSFQARYRTARARQLANMSDNLLNRVERNVARIEKLAEDPEVPANVRLAASKAILTAALQAAEMEKLHAEVTELRRKLAEKSVF